MPTLLELIWSDIPDAEKFIIEADDRPKEFNPSRRIAQSFRTETESTTIIFYFDGDGPEWNIRLTAVRFDGSKYRIKYKVNDWSDKTNGKAKLGFNEVDGFSFVTEWLTKRDTPVRVVISDPVTCEVFNDTVITHGDTVHIAKVPLNRSAAVDEAATDFLEWWDKEGCNRFDGAPACLFALRRAMSLPKDVGAGRDWTGVGADKPVSKP